MAKVTEFVTTGVITDGKLQVRNQRAFTEAMSSMRDGEVLVTIEKQHATRSAAQNRAYWGLVVHALSEHTGYTPEEVHELLKAKFLPKALAVPDANGEIVDEFVIGRSTTKLNKIEFGEYITQIQQWAAEALDVVIPDPLPYGSEDREERTLESARDLDGIR